MSIWACRMVTKGCNARRLHIVMRAGSWPAMQGWLKKSQGQRRRGRKTLWVEREGQRAFVTAVRT